MKALQSLVENKECEKTRSIEKITKKLIEMSHKSDGIIVVAIDGRCGSGKTTLSEYLSHKLHCSVIHMDDFFLPSHLRTPSRLKEPGGNIHYERFSEEIKEKLKIDKCDKISYGIFNCAKMCIDSQVVLPKTKIIIVEGTYSLHPNYDEMYHYKIFCNVDEEIQRQRIIMRNGKKIYENFKNKWIPMEERYFSSMDIKNKCDIILNMD
ncbi:Uridine kinase [Hathewaya proteolytica DSM 3090]|uniref:Uridine kinase n=1 Tax=Hathewaya proteolytica DSM 3090 TaxID=1121331 RepID=A0A1M6JPE8_9CLOT|nr:AAA family ATPase [Hathewaya proteolytica]SHJ48560.1 Uridine kinase [Hathewaya proteolytica DSM 3090]